MLIENECTFRCNPNMNFKCILSEMELSPLMFVSSFFRNDSINLSKIQIDQFIFRSCCYALDYWINVAKKKSAHTTIHSMVTAQHVLKYNSKIIIIQKKRKRKTSGQKKKWELREQKWSPMQITQISITFTLSALNMPQSSFYQHKTVCALDDMQ